MSAKKKTPTIPSNRGGDYADERIWIDRVAVELKAQREWGQKWQLLADPKLYANESSRTISAQAQKSKPTKWSAFSVINPPGKSPTEEILAPPPGFALPTYKITGTRDHYLNSASSSSGSRKNNPQRNNEAAQRLELKGNSIGPSTGKQNSSQDTFSEMLSMARRRAEPPKQPESRSAKTKKQNLTHSTFGSATHYTTSNNAQPSPEPSYYKAPFATDTPVSEQAITTLAKHHRASLRMYSTNLVGARSGTRSQFAEDPQKVYKHPVTSSMEYGWVWSGRKTLEIYGSTSADFTNGNVKARS